jgi:hypothetical protein
VRHIATLEAEIANLGPDVLELPIAVETQSDTRGTVVVTTSTVAREIVFVTSHMVHHNAIMGSLLAAQGIQIGARFGVAPATPLPREQLVCAQ